MQMCFTQGTSTHTHTHCITKKVRRFLRPDREWLQCIWSVNCTASHITRDKRRFLRFNSGAVTQTALVHLCRDGRWLMRWMTWSVNDIDYNGGISRWSIGTMKMMMIDNDGSGLTKDQCWSDSCVMCNGDRVVWHTHTHTNSLLAKLHHTSSRDTHYSVR